MHMEKVFTKGIEYGISLNPKKCVFGVKEGKFIGHIMSKEGIRIDPQRVAEIDKIPQQKNDMKKKQAYTLVKVVKNFKTYLMGARIIAYVPSAEVKDIFIQQEVIGRRCRWINRMQEFNIDVQITKLVKG